MRNALMGNQTITLASAVDAGHTRTFTIVETLGSGSSSIAHRAIDTRNSIPVIIKECFPSKDVIRGSDNALIWNTIDDETCDKERFKSAFDMQLRIQSANETMNTSTHLVDGLYAGNNTLYTVSDVQNAKTYDVTRDSTLQDICKTARAIAQAVGKYHAYGLLHLDIKPQNVLILPETREIVKLLDFDSVIQKSDTMHPGALISYTHEYAAPELLQGKRNKLCDATDIYAVGAVLFSRIFGHAPSAEDRGTFSDWDFSENPLFRRLSNKAHRLTKELLRKTLSASVRRRYQSADDLIAALNILVDESNPKKRHLNSTYSPSRNFFVGRSEELNNIRSAFMSGKRAIFLCGIGGIGKTELALHYAEQFKSHYDVIAFGRFNDSLDSLFKSPDFISIEHNSEGTLNLDAIRGLVGDRTLLIIDNFDNDTDTKLDAVLSLKCNLLFTSRNSFEEIYGNDSAVTHINVGELALQEQAFLFEHECGQIINDEDRDVIRLILQNTDGYTLLIPLIAKTYKRGILSLNEIRQKIIRGGIKGAADINIPHYKDRAFNDNFYNILREVLNMADFSENEICIMQNLAYLGDFASTKKALITFLDGKYQNEVNNLVDKGWIQIQGVGADTRISLHKIVKELVRNEFKPNSKNFSEYKYIKIWDESLKFAEKVKYFTNEDVAAENEDWSGYTTTELQVADEYQYHNLCNKMISEFKDCDLSNQDFCGFWAQAIHNVVNPIVGGADEFKDFLIKYTNEVGEASRYSHESMYKANITLMTYALMGQLKEGNKNIVSYATRAKEEACKIVYDELDDELDDEVDDELDEVDDELDDEEMFEEIENLHLGIFLPIYQRICILDAQNKEYWDDIPNFDELCDFIDDLLLPSSFDEDSDSDMYGDFYKRKSHEYITERCKSIRDVDIDTNEITAYLNSQLLMSGRYEDDDDLDIGDERSNFYEDVIEGIIDNEQRSQFADKVFDSPSHEHESYYDDTAEEAYSYFSWVIEHIMEELTDILEVSPIHFGKQELPVFSYWSNQEKYSKQWELLAVKNEFYPQVQASEYIHDSELADMEGMFSCAFVLVGNYDACQEHLVELLILFECLLNKTKKVTESHIRKLPGVRFLLNYESDFGKSFFRIEKEGKSKDTSAYLYGDEEADQDEVCDIVPVNLALWFIDSIIHISEKINASHATSNDMLLNVYIKAEELASLANNSEKKALFRSKIADVTK